MPLVVPQGIEEVTNVQKTYVYKKQDERLFIMEVSKSRMC
jgi:hypothetical protein